jgi:hypothetical protein
VRRGLAEDRSHSLLRHFGHTSFFTPKNVAQPSSGPWKPHFLQWMIPISLASRVAAKWFRKRNAIRSAIKTATAATNVQKRVSFIVAE